ncbi:otoancorin-like [Heterodontus francisci]|uniref:otoancorin-like n=1 Tax=Heterodontus francisci TaxID=7792 RepID=UPI00355AEEAE
MSNLQELGEKPWNEGQALYLCQALVADGSITADELGQLGPMVQGLTCEMIDKYGDQLKLEIGQILSNDTQWLSRTQLSCVAKKLKACLDSLQSDYFSQQVDTILQEIPSAFLLHLGEDYTCQRFAKEACTVFREKMAGAELELLPRSSPVRACVREEVLQCLNKPVSALNETDIGRLGQLVCEFTGQNISDLGSDVFNASIPQFCKCRQFHATAGSSLASKLLHTLGDVSDWTGDTVTSLGPMITFLDEKTLLQLPDTLDVKDALLQLATSQSGTDSAASPEFSTNHNLSVVYLKIFAILVQEPEKNDSQRTQTASCSVIPTREQIQELGEANTQWTSEQFTCMSTLTFKDTVEVLGSVTGFSREQLVALKDKAVEAWGSMSNFTQEDISNLKCLATALSVSELQSLDVSSIDSLAIISACPAWTREQQRAVLKRFLDVSGFTAADLGPIELSGLGSFVCGMENSLIAQLQQETIRLAAASLGTLTCSSETLGALKEKVTGILGPMKDWTAAEMSEFGTVAAGASPEDLKSLNPDVMPFLSSTAVSLIPPDRFQVLSVSQLKSLGPENAGAVTQAQLEQASEEQRSAVKEALGIPTQLSTSNSNSNSNVSSHAPNLGFFGLSHATHALLAILPLFL